MNAGQALLVGAGGAVGSVLRWWAVGAAARAFGTGFPFGTLGVNVLGSLIMGAAAAVLTARGGALWSGAGPFLMTGVLGGFTTFSAFSLDAARLMEAGRFQAAGLYILASVCASLLALGAGLVLGRAIA